MLPVSELLDSHCHFDFSHFDIDRHILWPQCQKMGLTQLIIPGTGAEQWPKAEVICTKHSGIYFAAGIHPWFIHSGGHWRAEITHYLDHPKCVAIGECGLDANIATPLSEQTPIFEQHLALAYERAMPLIIHAHGAHNNVQQLLKKYRPTSGGVIHAFSGSLELAQSYIQLGFKLGIGGSITYPRAAKTRAAAAHLPLESLVLETDAPDMPLHGNQGERNSPLKLLDIAQCLYKLRLDSGQTESLDDVIGQTTDNSRRLFNIKAP
mgnify:CR=1 FL=1